MNTAVTAHPFDARGVDTRQPLRRLRHGRVREAFWNVKVRERYAVHNWAGLTFGTIATGVGPMMAAVDNFELSFSGIRDFHEHRLHA